MPPTLSRTNLNVHVLASLRDGGYIAIPLTAENANPLRVAVSRDQFEQPVILRIYAWNITHGGGSARAADEYRIQLTGEMPQLVRGETTLVIGWSEQFEVFAGWDENIHAGRVSTSPSLQVRRETLEAAFDDGLHAALRNSGDVVVAFTSPLLATYCLFAEEIRAHPDGQLVADLNSIPALRGGAEIPTPSVPDRPRVVRIVESSYRAWDFNSRVMKAYGYKCAICGLQLGLTEAAHIVPVAWVGSTDLTSNGVALCRNHHRAYDASLISITPDYHVEVSSARMSALTDDRMGSGSIEWQALAGKILCVVPSLELDRPNPSFLATGRIARRWLA
jgi:putative restriction endonuclease